MKIRRRNIVLFYGKILSDLCASFTGLYLAYYVRFNYISFHLKPNFTPPHILYLIAFFFTSLCWILIFYLLGLYDTSKRHYIIDELYDTAKGLIFGILIALLPAFFYRSGSFSRLVLVIGAFFTFFLINFYRFILSLIIHYFNKKGRGVVRVAIVGGSEPGENIKDKIEKDPEYFLIGQILEKDTEKISKIEILGNSNDVENIVKQEKLDMLIMAYPLRNTFEVTKIIKKCSNFNIQLRFLPDIGGLISSRIGLYEIRGMPLLGIREFPLSGINIYIKRIVDVVISIIALIFLFPLMFFAAMGIKLTSPGSIFYIQERIGKNGKKFDMIKFRSMKQNAEKETGPVWTQENDPRKTKFGSFIRATSIDELPQLFNVLKGDMSIIGPRPEREFFVEKFREEIPRYMERHKVKPGITGWAQANDLRANSSIRERVEYDLYYIENWSWDFDIKILLRTVFTLLFHKNAY